MKQEVLIPFSDLLNKNCLYRGCIHNVYLESEGCPTFDKEIMDKGFDDLLRGSHFDVRCRECTTEDDICACGGELHEVIDNEGYGRISKECSNPNCDVIII